MQLARIQHGAGGFLKGRTTRPQKIGGLQFSGNCNTGVLKSLSGGTGLPEGPFFRFSSKSKPIECKKSARLRPMFTKFPGEHGPGSSRIASSIWCSHIGVWKGPLFDKEKSHPHPHPRARIQKAAWLRGRVWSEPPVGSSATGMEL